MWYEILPPMAIITGCLYLPQLSSWYLHKAVFGNPMRRDCTESFARTMFQRDTRIDGAPWKVRGLENIPDE